MLPPDKVYSHNVQPFKPVYDKNSKILVLGSFPSVESRKNNFYYGHPQNRFWKVLSSLYGETVPVTISDKRDMLLRNKTAVYDVIYSCDIIGSSDSSIKNVVPADISSVISSSQIKKIYLNGALSQKLYDRFIYPDTGIRGIKLPSTSPANARYSLEKLIEEWKSILD